MTNAQPIPATDQQVLNLVQQGWSHHDIAEAYRIPVDAVRTRLVNIRLAQDRYADHAIELAVLALFLGPIGIWPACYSLRSAKRSGYCLKRATVAAVLSWLVIVWGVLVVLAVLVSLGGGS